MNLEQIIAALLGPEGEADDARTARLAAIGADDLTGHLAALREGYTAARAGLPDDPSDEQLDALEVIQQAIAVAEGETARRAAEQSALEAAEREAAEQRRQRLAALDGAVGDGDGDGNGDGGEGDPTPADPPAGDPPAEPPAGDPPGGVQAAGGVRPRPSLAALDGLSGDRDEPAPPPSEFEVYAAAGGFRDVRAGARLNPNDPSVHAEIAGLHRSMQVQAPSTRKHYLGHVRLQPSAKLVACGNPADATPYIEQAVEQTVEARRELASLVASGQTLRSLRASGGSCAVAMPDYAIRFIGDRGTSFVDQLPGVIERRPMSYYPWYETDFNAANPWSDGMGTVTASEDEVGYGPEGDVPEGGHAYKGCVHIDCPTPDGHELEANFKCVTYGRFQAISFPEYVRVFDTSTALWFDVHRDQWAINKFIAKAGAGHTIQIEADSFNAVRELRGVLLRLLAHYRSARKSESLGLNVAAPNWLKYQLAAGMALEMDLTGNKIGLSPEQVWGMVATEGIDLMGYMAHTGPTSDGSETVLPLPTNTLPAWPSEIRLLVWPEGGVFRQTAGEVSFGLVETLYATNDYGTFMEQFEALGFRTGDLWVVDVKLCDSGVQGGSAVKSCAVSSS